MGSPRLSGNTAELCKSFLRKLEENGTCVRYITLADKKIAPCKGCYHCQDIQSEYGCVLHDDMYDIVDHILWADCIVFATPIYSWYCPAEMKAVLDRHFGLNKYYRSASGSLWEGRRIALLLTHGYEQEYAVTPFVEGIRRLCKHSNLRYLGMYSVRDVDDLASFQTKEAIHGAELFADLIIANMDSGPFFHGTKADLKPGDTPP